ncbi:MAG: GntR family transcriptional regulator [Armatimonadia bacterium]
MYLSLDPNSGAPLHLQLKEQMRLAIATGALVVGDQLPTVRELAAQLRINPNTIARVYRDLQAEGLLASRQGSGTFVAEEAVALAGRESADLVRARLRGAVALGRSVGMGWRELREVAGEILREAEEAGVGGEDEGEAGSGEPSRK